MQIPFWVILAVVTVIPMFRLLPHFGINRNWALIAAVPVGTAVLIWWIVRKLEELEKL